MSGSARAIGLLAGYLADLAFGDPRRFHPVAGFGQLATALERQTYTSSRLAGVAHATVLVGGAAALGAAAQRATRRCGAAEAVLVGTATWCVLGGRSLHDEGRAIDRLLDQGALPEARVRLTHLVSRATADLAPDEIARAAVESVAENTSDAVVAPLLWTAAAGVPGALTYRAANTLDAMIGYRNERYAEFGWAAARLDDALNYVPARVTATLVTVLGGAPGESLRAWRRDAPAHPSPNGGPVEAAFAGALGRRLGGRNSYAGVIEDRGSLGTGPAAGVGDATRAAGLAQRVDAAAAVLGALVALGLRRAARRAGF